MDEALSSHPETEKNSPWLEDLEAVGARVPHMSSDALAIGQLWLTHRQWAYRSVEQISFRETAWMQRILTLSVRIPWDQLDWECQEERRSAPIPILVGNRTAGLVALEAQSSTGQILPVRSLPETLLFGTRALQVILSGRFDQKLEEGEMALPPQDAKAKASSHTDWPDQAKALVQALHRRQLLIVDLPRTEASNEVIRIRWEETVTAEHRRLWIPPKAGITIDAGAVASPSRHISIDAPAGMEIDTMKLSSPSWLDVDARSTNAQQHLEAVTGNEEQLLLTLKPTRRAALQILSPALAVTGLCFALLASSALSTTQSAVAALLLLAPALAVGYRGRSGSIGAWIDWDIGSMLLGASSFVAAVALTLGAGELARDLLLALAGAMGALVAFAAAKSAWGLQVRWRPTGPSERMYLHYSARPPSARSPSDEEIEDAVDKLIESALTETTETRDAQILREKAAEMAREQSYVAVEAPTPPSLTGELIEDVIRLTQFDPPELGAYLDIPTNPLIERAPDSELSQEDQQKLANVRAAALVLCGSLSAAGIRKWLTFGEESPLSKISRGEVDDLRQRLDAYTSSPAE
jgi:hypothetical protein